MKKRLILALKILVSVGALYFVFSKIDVSQFFSVFKKLNIIWLFPAAMFFILSKIISAYRLNDLLKQIGVNISHRYNLKLYLLGMYYNLFLPGGIGGDGYKIYLLGKEFDIPRKKIFYAILLDRLGGLGIIVVLLLLLIGFGGILEHFSNIALLLIPIGFIAFYLIIKLLFPDFLNSFFKINLYSFGVQISQILSVICILASLNIFEKLIEFSFLFLLSSVAVAVPITIGGAGTRELTFLFGADTLGLPSNISIALSFIFYIITAIVSFAGIYFSFNEPQTEKT